MDKHSLKERRKRLGMSQKVLSQRLDVARETIVRWEQGSDDPAHPGMLDLALDQLETIDRQGNSG